MSGFGWTHLSRDALRRAEAQLSGEAAGVRDEIGFLLIHQRYADRLFPGTSILHTRLRYVLFIPWIYDDLRRHPAGKRAAPDVRDAELDLTRRLLKAGGGVIGRLNYPKTTSQPPSVVYWTALGTWGLLRPRADGRMPSRAQVLAMLRSAGRVAEDDDGVPLAAPGLPFVTLPSRPPGWDSGGDLDFVLTPQEADFLRRHLTAVPSPSTLQPSLLARLAASPPPQAEHCWDKAVLNAAAHDRRVLERAGQAAVLAAIGRGVYAALVETLCEEQDRRGMPRTHRDHLPEVVASYARRAERLDLGALAGDIGPLPALVTDVLQQTQSWIAKGAGDPAPLRDAYAAAERSRKGLRARLTNDLSGRERRYEWNSESHTLAEPLHFRWDRVHKLLSDLHGVA